MRKADHLRLGLVITDDRAAIFTPIPLNIEEFPKSATSPNAVELSVPEANRIIDAVAPKPTATDAAGKSVAESGRDEVAKTDLQVLEQALEDAPPVVPDLARQMWVLNRSEQSNSDRKDHF